LIRGHNSASEVVREALRLLADRDQLRRVRLAELRRKIQEGWDSLRRGEGEDGETFMARLSSELDGVKHSRESRRAR